MIPKNKSRTITVDSVIYRYAISCSWKEDGWCNFNITIQNEISNGSKLLAKGLVTRNFWLDFPNPESDSGAYPVITPKHIKSFIRMGISDGWEPNERGSNFVLSVTNEHNLN